MQQSKSRASWGFLVHLANIRTIGSSVFLMLIFYCLAFWTFSSEEQHLKGWTLSILAAVPLELLKQQSKIIYTSPQPIPVGHITEQI